MRFCAHSIQQLLNYVAVAKSDSNFVRYCRIIGASLSEPHIDEFAVEFLSLSLSLDIYISYVVP